MDGFNVVPVDKDNFKDSAPPLTNAQQASSFDSGIEIVDEESEKLKQKAAEGGGWILFLAFLVLIGVIGYFVFLVFYRVTMLAQVQNYGDQLKEISKNIDVKEMQEFQAMDSTLKAIDGRLSNHVLTSEILGIINQNLRSTLQVTEYRLDVRESDVEVVVSVTSPSFKELAEQTEKFFLLKESKQINSFIISDLAFESETKRLKFSMRVTFDKKKVTANNI